MVIRDVDEAVERLDPSVMAIDLETSGLSPFRDAIAVVGLADRHGQVAVLHARGSVPERLARFIESAGLLIGFNAVNFDGPFLETHGVRVLGVPWFDCYVAEQVVSCQARSGISKSLAATLPRRLGGKAQKVESPGHTGWMNAELTDHQVAYAAGDIRWLHDLMDAHIRTATESGDLPALELEQAIVPVVMRMRMNGLPIDREELSDYLFEMGWQRDQAYQELREMLGYDLNFRSPQQVLRAFESYAGELPRDKTGKPTTGKEVLWEMQWHDSPMGRLAKAMVTFRDYDQPLKMYDEAWQATYIQPDGAIHANYTQCGTDTGRFSSSEPNMQQVPRKDPVSMRHVFIAPEGFKYVAVDYSQIEVRLAAWVAEDPAMLQAIAGEDIHREMAARIFDKPVSEVTKDERQTAKSVSFILLFGGSPDKLQAYSSMYGSHITLEESQRLCNAFYSRFAKTWAYRQAMSRQARTSNVVVIRLASGLRRILSRDADMLTAQRIINTKVQGNAAVGLKNALRRLRATMVEPYLAATVHDEVVAVVPDGLADEALDTMMREMLLGMQEFCDIPLKVEGYVGKSWAKADAENRELSSTQLVART